MKSRGLVSELADYWSAPAASPQLPIWRQLLEMTLLYLLRHVGPGYYVQARWGRAKIPFRDKWQHVNRTEYRRLIRRLNSEPYQKASQHKLIEKSVLTLQRLPTPKFIAFVHPVRGKCAQGQPIRNPRQLSELLARHVHERVCFKHVEGWGGFGFASYLIISVDGSVQLLRQQGETPLTVENWWQMNTQGTDGILLEAHLEQHPDLAALNESSVNTIRIWVVLEGNRWQVLGGYLRVGRRGSQVDNNSSGGIACPVDVKTGKVREAFDPARAGYALAAHPDSNIALTGFQIPFWQEATVLAGEAVAAFPHMRLAGLDMAITPVGPSLIELNMMPDYIGCAWMDLPLKTRLQSSLSERALD